MYGKIWTILGASRAKRGLHIEEKNGNENRECLSTLPAHRIFKSLLTLLMSIISFFKVRRQELAQILQQQ